MTIKEASDKLYEELKLTYEPSDYTVGVSEYPPGDNTPNKLTVCVLARGLSGPIKKKYNKTTYEGYQVDVKYTGRFRAN